MSSFTKLPNQKKLTCQSLPKGEGDWSRCSGAAGWRCQRAALLELSFTFFEICFGMLCLWFQATTTAIPRAEKMADGSRIKRPSFLASGVEVRYGSKLSGCVSNHMDKHVMPNPTCCLQTRTVPKIYVASLRLLLFPPDFSIGFPIGSQKLPV